MRPLTDTQRAVLAALLRHGSWYPGKAWVWDNRSTTIRHLDALVRKGYAIRLAGAEHVYRPTNKET